MSDRHYHHTIHYIPHTRVFEHFLGLSPAHLTELQARVARSNNHLNIWVHPLFVEQWPETFSGREREDVSITDVQHKLRAAFLETIAATIHDPATPPLMIYEGMDTLPGTRAFLAKTYGLTDTELDANNIVFMPTETKSPALHTHHLLTSLRAGSETDQQFADTYAAYSEAKRLILRLNKVHEQIIHYEFPELEDPHTTVLSDERIRTYVARKAELEREYETATQQYEELRRRNSVSKRDFTLSLLRHILVHHVSISGVYMDTSKNPLTGEDSLTACAGTIARQLRESDIDVIVTDDIWPPKEEGWETEMAHLDEDIE